MAAIASIAASGSRGAADDDQIVDQGFEASDPAGGGDLFERGTRRGEEGQQRFDDVGGPGEGVRRGPVFHPVSESRRAAGRGTGMRHCPNPCREVSTECNARWRASGVGRRTGTVRPPPREENDRLRPRAGHVRVRMRGVHGPTLGPPPANHAAEEHRPPVAAHAVVMSRYVAADPVPHVAPASANKTVMPSRRARMVPELDSARTVKTPSISTLIRR